MHVSATTPMSMPAATPGAGLPPTPDAPSSRWPALVRDQTGSVSFFNEAKGYGYVSPAEAGAKALFFSYRDVTSGRQPFNEFNDGDRVVYDLAQVRRGELRATNVRLVEPSASV